MVTLDGLPAGIELTTDDVAAELARRRLGYGRGARMKFEADVVSFIGGVRHGRTLGSPVAVEIANTEWERNPDKWQREMSVRAEDGPTQQPLTQPRPGHADLPGMQKYDHDDARPILERASARETAARVAGGTAAKAFLKQAFGIEIVSHVKALGPIRAKEGLAPTPDDFETVDADPLRCMDPEASGRMVAEVDAAKKDADTLGGAVEVLAYNVPPGLGSHVQWDRKLDARLATALMSIQSVKAVEIGDGLMQASVRGSSAHDEIVPGPDGVQRLTDRAGGLEGGITTGQPLRVSAMLKPISSLTRPLRTIDTTTGKAAEAINQRSDVCAVPAGAVVAEHMVAYVLAEAALEKFGGDSVGESRRNFEHYIENLQVR